MYSALVIVYRAMIILEGTDEFSSNYSHYCVLLCFKAKYCIFLYIFFLKIFLAIAVGHFTMQHFYLFKCIAGCAFQECTYFS